MTGSDSAGWIRRRGNKPMMTARYYDASMLFVNRVHSSQPVVLTIGADDARRIVRALEETSAQLGPTPGGSRCGTEYRRLAAEIKVQAHLDELSGAA